MTNSSRKILSEKVILARMSRSWIGRVGWAERVGEDVLRERERSHNHSLLPLYSECPGALKDLKMSL